MGWVGQFVAGWHIRRKLERMFAYRHEATKRAVQAGGGS
jgi:ligand-binding SRPBCC domain-containing protein